MQREKEKEDDQPERTQAEETHNEPGKEVPDLAAPDQGLDMAGTVRQRKPDQTYKHKKCRKHPQDGNKFLQESRSLSFTGSLGHLSGGHSLSEIRTQVYPGPVSF